VGVDVNEARRDDTACGINNAAPGPVGECADGCDSVAHDGQVGRPPRTASAIHNEAILDKDIQCATC